MGGVERIAGRAREAAAEPSERHERGAGTERSAAAEYPRNHRLRASIPPRPVIAHTSTVAVLFIRPPMLRSGASGTAPDLNAVPLQA